MISTKKYTYKIIAGVLSLVMVFGVLAIVPSVSTQAVEINANDQGFTLYGAGSGTTTGFESGTQISVTNISRTADNKKTAVYTYGENGWTKAGNDYVVWQGTGNNTFEAYTPVVTGASYTEFTLPTDQTAGVSAADWMTAAYTGAKGEKDEIDLAFAHRLSKVTVKVTGWGDQYTGEEALTEPTFVSVHSKVTANGADNTRTNVSTTWTTGTNPTATVILVPGAYSALENFFTFKVDGNALSVNAPTGLALEAGKHYTFDLTVGKDTVLVSSVTVEGWEPDTLDGGAAKKVYYNLSLSGTTAIIEFQSYATSANVTEALSEAGTNVTDFIINGTPLADIQSALANALNGKTTTVYFPQMSALAGGVTFDENVGVILAITDPAKTAVGDVAMLDGTFIDADDLSKLTKSLVNNITPAGIVFWTVNDAGSSTLVGEAAADKIMAADYPNCTHGLIVSLAEVKSAWQLGDYRESVCYNFQNTDLFNPANKSSYLATLIETDDGNLQKILGYQNTKVLEAYNEYCKNTEGKANYEVKALTALQTLAQSNPAPANSTGWYLPSAKEVHILAHGDVNDNINTYTSGEFPTATAVNASLNAIGRTPLDVELSGNDSALNCWSSTEQEGTEAYFVCFHAEWAKARGISKKFSYAVRGVCAY